MTTPRMPDPPATGSCAPASTIDAATVLENAADLLLIHGRCRKTLRRPTGEYCALGAIYEAEGRFARGGWLDGPSSDAAQALTRRLASNIPDWNDNPATTDDEVRDTLLLVAKDLRNTAVPS